MNPFPKVRLTSRQSAAVSTDNIGTNTVPTDLEVTPTGEVTTVEGEAPPKVVKAHDYFVLVGTNLADGLVAGNRQMIAQGLEHTLDNITFQANLSESMQAVVRPKGAEKLLDPAMESLSESWPALSELAKNAVKDESLEDLLRRHGYIKYLRVLKTTVDLFSESLTNTIALAETDVYNRLRGIYQRCSSTCLTNRRVQRLTEALVALFTQSAQDAADQRQANEKRDADTRAEVLAETAASPQQPPQAGAAGDPATQGQGTVGIPVGGSVMPPPHVAAAPASARTAPRGSRKKQP